MMLNMDPPEHLRLRLVSAVVTRRLERSAERIAARARALLDAVAGSGECDLPIDATDDFPLANLADPLGVPAADRELLLCRTNRVIGYQDLERAEVVRGS